MEEQAKYDARKYAEWHKRVDEARQWANAYAANSANWEIIAAAVVDIAENINNIYQLLNQPGYHIQGYTIPKEGELEY